MGITHGNNGLEQGNIKHTCRMMGRVPEVASAFIFTSLSTFVTTAFMTPATRSRSLRDSAAVTERRMPGRARTTRLARAPCPRYPVTAAPHGRYQTMASAEGLQGRRRRWHRPTQADMNDRRGCLDAVQHGPDRPHVLLLRIGNVFRRLLMPSPSEARLPESRDGSGENE